MNEIDAEAIEAAKLYGPCWEDVLKVIRQAEALTTAQLARATALVEVLDEAALNAAWAATRLAADATGRLAAWNAAWPAAWDAVDATWNTEDAAACAAARAATWAAAAAVVSDLGDKPGLTAAHIAVLTQVWREIIGTT